MDVAAWTKNRFGHVGPGHDENHRSQTTKLFASVEMIGTIRTFEAAQYQQVTEAMNAARGEADPAKRAQDVIAAQKVITEQLVWIPLVAPNTVLVMNDKVTGPPSTFSFMFSPWASYLGGS